MHLTQSPQHKLYNTSFKRGWWSIITFGEWTTAVEGIACVRFRAAADGRQSTEIAVSASSTGSVARVLADSVDARGTTTGAVSIAIALCTALCVGTADVSGGALAHGTVVARDLAVGPLSALVTSTHALEAGTMLLVATLGVVLTLVATSLNGVALRTEGGGGPEEKRN